MMKKSRAEEFDLDFYAQEEIYKRQTGDKHWYLGFGVRFAAWLEQNQRRELIPPSD